MKKYLLLILLFPAISFAQDSTKSFIHYNLYATLNSEEKTITGFEKIMYKNTSDTAQNFLWIRLYPNAYANDRTAYSDYLLKQGDTRFYFAKEEKKGYINQLDFKQNGFSLKTEFDSSKNDLIKVYFSNSLQPGDSVEISTPFFVKIPYDFSGFGYNDDDEIYLSHWYPEVAYQDGKGWDLKSFVSYNNLETNISDFDTKVITDRKKYQSNAAVIKETVENNNTIRSYSLRNAGDFNLSNAMGIFENATLSDTEQNFDKLIPSLLQNKIPDNPVLTQYLINQKIQGIDSPLHKTLKSAFLFNLKETDKYNYLSFLPAVGYNNYDKFMAGAMIHNYQLPLNKFNFLVAPMYATNTKTLAGVGRLEYNIWGKNDWWKFAVSGEKYTFDKYQAHYEDGTSFEKYLNLLRVVPSITYTKYYDDTRLKKLIFNLRAFILHQDTIGSFENPYGKTVLGELQTTYKNERALYPYAINLKADGAKDFLRIGLTGKGFLNYDASGKGLNVRLFAGKFFYLNNEAHYGYKSIYIKNYFLSLSGVQGYSGMGTQPNDFTYSDYFIGRNESSGWMSQQITQSGGFLKLPIASTGTDIGNSDNWIAALNFTADLPDKINPFSKLPFSMPVRVFLDVGTYSEAWADGYSAPSGKYLYDAGLQVSLFRDVLTVYFPLLYSKVFRDAYKQNYSAKRFVHTISFSIDLGKLKPKVLNKILPL